MIRKKYVLLIFICALVLAACQTAAKASPSVTVEGQEVVVEGGSYTDVSATELQVMLANKDFTFVNVHIPFEGDIANTDLSIPYDQIADNLDQLPSTKDAKIVLYCRSGHMSGIAAQTLVGLGYTNIWNLSGGMVAWEQAGFDIER
jgi:rhodanese-related sulfurtransferase